jgi:hypothetical protein
LNPQQFVSQEFALENLRAAVPSGTLLVTSTGVGSAGRTFLKLGGQPMIADAHITVLQLADPTDAAFLCAFLQSPVGIQQLLRLRRGSSRQIEIYPEDIVSVLVPPIRRETRAAVSKRWIAAVNAVEASSAAVYEAEQRIVSRLGQNSRAASAEIKGWDQPLSGLMAGRRIDAEYCTPGVSELRDQLSRAGAIPLSELILTARKGLQPDAYVEGGPVHVIKSKDVHYPDFDLALCDTTTEDSWPFFLGGDEVLLNMTGIGTLGRSTVVPRDAAEVNALIPSVDVMALTVDSSIALPQYVALFLNSPFGRRITSSLQTGSSGQQHLYPTHFAEIPVLVPRTRSGKPDLEWQRGTIERAERRNAALFSARAMGIELDKFFLEELGIAVDMSIIPA